MPRPLPSHCVNGHRLTAGNFYEYTDRTGRHRRQCRECKEASRHSPYSGPLLPTAPLAGVLRRVIAENPGWGGEESGVHHLARQFSWRYGVPHSTAERMLCRLMAAKNRMVRLSKADEWLTLVGSHLALVYPELYFEEAA